MFLTQKAFLVGLTTIFFVIFSCGCEEKTKPGSAISKAEPAEVLPAEKAEAEPVKAEAVKTPVLALNFSDKSVDVYKVTTESSKGVEFEGKVSDNKSFQGGTTSSNIEIVFKSELVSVDDQGNGVEKITVDSLKYIALVKTNPVIDFDSSRDKDKISPLFGLVGKSYTIKRSPNGKVLEVVDADDIRGAVQGDSSTHKAGQMLMSEDLISQRHGCVVLPEDGNDGASNWSDVASFDFGLMGSQSYERVYTADKSDGAGVLTFSMSAPPTSEMAEEIHKQQQTSDFSKMFDNQETYSGKLVFDFEGGKIKHYTEKLDSHWLAVDPSAGKNNADGPPAALKMSVTKGYTIEKLN